MEDLLEIGVDHYLDREDGFIIENYSEKKTFSSFLPGIAGLKGIPIWAFYVNRGQGICSFGIRDKDKPIMEFFPAYKSYQNVEYSGFRTFIKVGGGTAACHYEPFSDICPVSGRKTRMIIGFNDLTLEDINLRLGIKTTVRYFVLPNEPLAALVRQVSIQNISGNEQTIEVLDGMPSLIPYGITDAELKEMGNTLKAWMAAENTDSRIPLFKLRAGTKDTDHVAPIEGGHFYFCMDKDEAALLKPVVDPDNVFGNRTGFGYPARFAEGGLAEVYREPQAVVNKIPCAFFGTSKRLKSKQVLQLSALAGHVSSMQHLNTIKDKIARPGFIEQKAYEAKSLLQPMTDEVYTHTASRTFDAYCRQTYLDNLIRGGYPLLLTQGGKQHVHYVYSRKHGDLERDYNFFATEPEFFSTGNGNFRDVNQNRRGDVFFHPEIGDFNIKVFMNLIQADGYNPLVLNGQKFMLEPDADRVYSGSTEDGLKSELDKLLSQPFTLGKLYALLLAHDNIKPQERDELAGSILSGCRQIIEASHHEGYWTDHWTYNLDLIESYLAVYPDQERRLLLEDKTYTYHESKWAVRKREHKYVLIKGEARQQNTVEPCEGKQARGCNSTLLVKLVVLAVNKFSTLDPMGMGVEMEAGKPGWNDALNGLPGLFGSSMAESYELARLLRFITGTMERYGVDSIEIPIEIWALVQAVAKCIERYHRESDDNKDFVYWDSVASAREEYREKIRLGFCGQEIQVKLAELAHILITYHHKLTTAIEKAWIENNGMYPTYFYYEAEDYEYLFDNKGKQCFDRDGSPLIRIKGFRQKKLPIFLEGIVRAMKLQNGKEEAKAVYDRVRQSSLYDAKLNMYKNNESLEGESMHIGRIRAFTPGWFENETVWLHMEYKYMLALLKSRLYEVFFRDFRQVMIPFLNPESYGRSPLENSSFIVSSANPDKTLHGRGFAARLSGATAEFISIWQIMMAGEKPFAVRDGQLVLQLKPILPEWIFDEQDQVTFNFLGRTRVVYHNDKRLNTYDEASEIREMRLFYSDGREANIEGHSIQEPYSRHIREGEVSKILVEM